MTRGISHLCSCTLELMSPGKINTDVFIVDLHCNSQCVEHINVKTGSMKAEKFCPVDQMYKIIIIIRSKESARNCITFEKVNDWLSKQRCTSNCCRII